MNISIDIKTQAKQASSLKLNFVNKKKTLKLKGGNFHYEQSYDIDSFPKIILATCLNRELDLKKIDKIAQTGT
jgi:outer membrane protease